MLVSYGCSVLLFPGTVMRCDLEEGEIAGDVEPVDSSRSSPIVAEDLLVNL